MQGDPYEEPKKYPREILVVRGFLWYKKRNKIPRREIGGEDGGGKEMGDDWIDGIGYGNPRRDSRP